MDRKVSESTADSETSSQRPRVETNKWCSTDELWTPEVELNRATTKGSFRKPKPKLKICVAGGGNGGHVMAGLFASKGHDVSLLVSAPHHVDKWLSGIEAGGLTVHYVEGDRKVKGTPITATHNPADVVPYVDLIIIVIPAKYHQPMIEAMAPHFRPGQWVCAVEGAWWGIPPSVFGPNTQQLVFAEIQCLPWACRATEYGRYVEVFEEKDLVEIAVSPSKDGREVARILQQLMDIPFKAHGSLLAMALSAPCNWVHPAVMYGHFAEWDGKPFPRSKVPLFYHDITQDTADMLERLDDEYRQLKTQLEQRCPLLDLSAIKPTKELLMEYYHGKITDESTTLSCFASNPGYDTLSSPVVDVGEGMVVPNFDYRYLNSDIPFGLVVTRGVAQLAGVSMPTVDFLIRWSQEKLGKEWLLGDKLCGRDMGKTRAPQVFDCHTLDEFVKICLPELTIRTRRDKEAQKEEGGVTQEEPPAVCAV
ncbi:unnamed protein product [Vitrella brassicaformis CCMP3155]|uniref:Opine dehydrogenase domain-containing protein n=1 Tax=Vitrella brassicaformis (strain CCMP3155) TaxID=1169540 RepID=A0A0G4EUC9_VITBC|nr:unnamed protein product [Vitrella brassicaformis CCMP3155]|eukprot:CEM01810.1 unnamed protein product [Vitrella brassicaformis CCMP3155]